ncbi:pentatricopeptide repeat-containing protein 1, mitochondrial [Leptopilina heterotoma]|uniref:pentatricopeptide repeat-containing protein 1, mitochondrial n=1 Tax=Leptopilina heterotoma TaxID=63436 RepID=UPI001CA99465|nr:pentatricopeptide repeat-containing protein 1, mitochondrial [Leptopilina heterotoma]XP_043481061.1 pentatricopeptide repeat-containing protein 1, mitochondrial [Leptopilina heterotoma]
MFSLKINSLSIRLNNVVRTCGNKKQYILQSQHIKTLTNAKESDNKTVKRVPFVNITPLLHVKDFRTFCTEVIPKDPDIFGDIGERKYDLVELDEKEKKVEEFEENEAKPLAKYRHYPSEYAKMLKQHIQNGDLASAENVFLLAQKNRDKPTLYMYSLLMRAFAVQGNVKKCFKLYNKLKNQSLKPNEAIVTSLINACSNSTESRSLEILHDFRSYLFNVNFPLNQTHYNALIKAYSRHGQVEETFQLLDEMRDKKLPIDHVTINNLLHGAGSQKEIGLKYALVVWHLMKFHNVTPSIVTYNLLFRAIRDTELGNLKVNDILIAESEKSKIILTESGRPDLLATPPVVRILPEVEMDPKNRRRFSRKRNVGKNEDDQSGENNVDLNKIIKNNRLMLFGGFDGLLKRMESDGVVPNRKTFTLCLESIANTKEAETHLMRMARINKVKLDTGFFNVLIKRRCFRYDYDDAKAVLGEMEQNGCEPDIITWGVIALSCQNKEDGLSLLNCIRNLGIAPNYFIYGTLLRTACNRLNLDYAVELLEMMMKQKLKPSEYIYDILDKFKRLAAEAIEDEKPTIKDMDRFKIDFTKFKLRCSKLQKMFRYDKRGVYESTGDD